MNNLLIIGMLLAISFGSPECVGQNRYSDFTSTLHRLFHAKDEGELNVVWNELLTTSKIPLVAEDSVAFLYRGPGRTVSWIGDFNAWGQSKSFSGKATRIPPDIWVLKTTLPRDARIDYKIVINNEQHILDPANPSSQWSGVGGGSLNSELRMPDWEQDIVSLRHAPQVAVGALEKDIVFNSRELGYQLTYSIYTPPGQATTYPIAYVTDGYEYMHERMGNMPIVLDNLINAGKIAPLVVVFIDHREPVNRLHNRRMQELAMNEKFASFLSAELIPYVEARTGAGGSGSRRAVIGTSIGGLAATWLAFSMPETFGRAGVQSPAYWFRPDIYPFCEKSVNRPEKIFLSSGLIHDGEDGTLKMRDIFSALGCPYRYEAVNQGHSWGNWRDLIDDMLIYLFPAEL